MAKAAAKAKPACQDTKASQTKKARAPRARPVGLADDYELATTMNDITWLVNFINFGVLFVHFHLDVGYRNCHDDLYAVSAGIIILNGIFIPMKFSEKTSVNLFPERNSSVEMAQTRCSSRHTGQHDGTSLAHRYHHRLHAIPIVDRFRQHHGHHHVQFGTIFIILWFVDRFLRNGRRWAGSLRPGLWRIPSNTFQQKMKRPQAWARLENMGNFGDQLLKRQEERKAKKEEKEAKAGEETELQED